ncbi:MAG: hypothetical protein LBO00_09140 [Zoogloeaceae bacterium]|nr:hypothetical protein [Zoogloeaceae bacterium]
MPQIGRFRSVIEEMGVRFVANERGETIRREAIRAWRMPSGCNGLSAFFRKGKKHAVAASFAKNLFGVSGESKVE